MITTKATSGCCRKKKQNVQSKLVKSCIEKSIINTQVDGVRRLHTSPADNPIRIYNAPQTKEKTSPGGVNDDFWINGYQVSNDSLCRSIET